MDHTVISNTFDGRPELVIRNTFIAWMYENRWTYAEEQRVLVDPEAARVMLAQLGTLERQYIDGAGLHSGHAIYVTSGRRKVLGCKVTSQLMGNYLWFSVAGDHEATVRKIVARLMGLETKPKKDEPRVPIHFRTVKNTYQRMIEVPRWKDIADNYPQSTREQMAELLAPGYRPPQAGQLLLWHGEPGTGKTFLLRALASEWRKWCRTNYIVDPGNFFAGDADYTLSVLLDDGNPIQFQDDDEEQEEKEMPWKLIVAEDTGELLSHDAKERTGQGLSRLLNIVDGLVGQGLKTLVLITTNEQLDKMHPAVTRNGRCLNSTEFGLFTPAEARAWLRAHEGDEKLVKGPMRLADLYALLDGRKVQQSGGAVPFGFGAATPRKEAA